MSLGHATVIAFYKIMLKPVCKFEKLWISAPVHCVAASNSVKIR